jgi:hypothetical protein
MRNQYRERHPNWVKATIIRKEGVLFCEIANWLDTNYKGRWEWQSGYTDDDYMPLKFENAEIIKHLQETFGNEIHNQI